MRQAGKEIRRRCKSNPNDKAGCIKLGDLYNWVDYDYWIVEEKIEPLIMYGFKYAEGGQSGLVYSDRLAARNFFSGDKGRIIKFVEEIK